ncbi:MAG: hypothetical protein LBI53_00110 [Candidatus Peribacteria bacterium]|nr:hypothetical protein [Candidatus Peribacteria bacterium]
MKDAIRFITTGGTIDDIDFDNILEQEQAQSRKSIVFELLQQARITNNIYIYQEYFKKIVVLSLMKIEKNYISFV